MNNRRLVISGAGILALVLLLGGAAFVGGQLFRQQEQAQASNNTQGLPRKLVTPVAGVPASEPDARGDTTRREGNSIFICDPTNTMSLNLDGTVNKDGDCAPVVEVVIGHDTVFLHDVTARQYGNNVQPTPGQDLVLTQAIESGSADDISQGTAVRAWGQRAGSRIVARTILYWNRSPRPSGTPGS
jgi:hypothetical protein